MNAPVLVVDEVLLPTGSADAWLAEWRASYLPAATDHGLELRGAWRGASDDPDHAVIVIHWELPTIEAFWAARGRAGADDAVRAFWDATDALAIRRDRRALAAVRVTP